MMALRTSAFLGHSKGYMRHSVINDKTMKTLRHQEDHTAKEDLNSVCLQHLCFQRCLSLKVPLCTGISHRGAPQPMHIIILVLTLALGNEGWNSKCQF